MEAASRLIGGQRRLSAQCCSARCTAYQHVRLRTSYAILRHPDSSAASRLPVQLAIQPVHEDISPVADQGSSSRSRSLEEEQLSLVPASPILDQGSILPLQLLWTLALPEAASAASKAVSKTDEFDVAGWLLQNPFWTGGIALFLVVVVPRIINGTLQTLAGPGLFLLALWAGASHPTETLAIILSVYGWVMEHPTATSIAILLVSAILLLPSVLLGGLAAGTVLLIWEVASQDLQGFLAKLSEPLAELRESALREQQESQRALSDTASTSSAPAAAQGSSVGVSAANTPVLAAPSPAAGTDSSSPAPSPASQKQQQKPQQGQQQRPSAGQGGGSSGPVLQQVQDPPSSSSSNPPLTESGLFEIAATPSTIPDVNASTNFWMSLLGVEEKREVLQSVGKAAAAASAEGKAGKQVETILERS